LEDFTPDPHRGSGAFCLLPAAGGFLIWPLAFGDGGEFDRSDKSAVPWEQIAALQISRAS